MKVSKYLFFTILTFVVLGFGTAQAQNNLAQEAYALFFNKAASAAMANTVPLPKISSLIGRPSLPVARLFRGTRMLLSSSSG